MDDISRRALLAAAALGSTVSPAAARSPRYKVEAGSEGYTRFQAVHEGLGAIDVRLFDFGSASAPANFLIYDIPVGASEGVHLHNLTDPGLGPYDEYYYILEGRGRMTIDGDEIIVGPGDHIHAPLDSWRGIANIDGEQHLKIFLTYIDRSTKA